jgi:hypothetical protein
MDKIILKIIWKSRGIKITKRILKRKKKNNEEPFNPIL